MNCPKCNNVMEPKTFGTVKVDQCTTCKGLWFDMGEIDELRKYAGSDLVDSGDPALGKKFADIRKIDCPKCHTHMIKMVDANQPHIHFESCTSCFGIFLDAGEYSDMIDDNILDRIHDFWIKIKGQEL